VSKSPLSASDTHTRAWQRGFLTALPTITPSDHPVLDLLRERARAGSVPGRRADPHVVCLAVEGGGMRGAVTAGMCLVLAEAGLIPSFDRIYGCSSGAIAGCFAAAGQAARCAASFEDAACRAFIDPRRALRRRPVLDLAYLFETLIARRGPLSADGLARGPELRALAVSCRDAELRVLAGFDDAADALAAVRASCAIPLLAGSPPRYRGEPLVDGGLLESIPYRTALREGASHVLVLRSRPAGFRTRTRVGAAERVVARAHPQLAPLLRTCHARYNDHAADLEWLARDPDGRAVVSQVTPPPEARLVSRLSIDAGRLAESLRVGAESMACALGGERAAPPLRPVPQLAPGGAAALPAQAA
jgi:predicted patatin/cPLA2 family phospholipase